MSKEIKLGNVVKDRVTGYQGVVVARTEWLNGCVRFSVQSQELKEGKPLDSQGFDIQQLEYVAIGIAQEEVKSARIPGGPNPEPTRQSDPVRQE